MRADEASKPNVSHGVFRMTREQSKSLKVGKRVQWDNSLADRGTVIEVDWHGVTIKWDDGQTNTLFHNDMARVEQVPGRV